METIVIRLPKDLNEKYSTQKYMLIVRHSIDMMFSVSMSEDELHSLECKIYDEIRNSTKTDPSQPKVVSPTIPKGNETIVLNETSSFNKPPKGECERDGYHER